MEEEECGSSATSWLLLTTVTVCRGAGEKGFKAMVRRLCWRTTHLLFIEVKGLVYIALVKGRRGQTNKGVNALDLHKQT